MAASRIGSSAAATGGDLARKRTALTLVAAGTVLVIMAAAVFLASQPSRQASQQTTTVPPVINQVDQYAHLSTAYFALVAPRGVLDSNQRFASLAGSKYQFLYANASNFTGVERSQFIVLVVNSSNSAYAALALDAMNGSALAYAENHTNGIIISKSDVWADGQTVFLLVGYKNASALTAALLSFFVKAPVYAPNSAIARFANFNGTANLSGSKDPIMDAYLDGTYELGPSDRSLYYPYNYYEEFAYLIYQAPIAFPDPVPGFEGNASGLELPLHAMVCVPPPPPIPGSSICIGDYAAMPMFQVGNSTPSQPQWSMKSADCDFPGIDVCVDTEGFAASGIDPQLPWAEIPSIFYGFTSTGSEIPPSMTGTSGPALDSAPLVWLYYGPGSLGSSIAGQGLNIIGQNATQLLIDSGVEMFSTPYNETPIGNFTGTGFNKSTGGKGNATYACRSSYCGMFFNYAIYALMTQSSNLPAGLWQSLPPNEYQVVGPGTGYYSVLRPVTLTTPKVLKGPYATYYFSYWSVYSEIDGNQYYQRFNTSNATFQVIGPTQAEAVYTHTSAPGSIEVKSGYIPISDMVACPSFINCSVSPALIGNVSFKISSLNTSVAVSNATDSNGVFATRTLLGGCYNVSAYKAGYQFFPVPNPVCVNGASGVYLIDYNPYVFEIAWPKGYAYGGAPVNSTVPIDVTVKYPAGGPAANLAVHASVGSGTISGSSITSANGTAIFDWRTGGTSGIYDLNFTASGLFTPSQTYSVTAVVYSANYHAVIMHVGLASSSVGASQGGSSIDAVTVHVCQFVFNLSANATLSCSKPYRANMSVSGLPSGIAAVFTPNPATPGPGTTDDSSVLTLKPSASVATGTYNATISASITLPNGTRLTGAARLMVAIEPSPGACNGLGAVSGAVYRFGEPTPANVTLYRQSGGVTYRNTTRNGTFYTGFVLPSGSYSATAYSIYSSSYPYGSATVNVTPCNTSSVVIGQPPTNTTSVTSTTSSTTSSTALSTTSTSTTIAGNYYSCNVCNGLLRQGYSCPPSCPDAVSCIGGFKCTA